MLQGDRFSEGVETPKKIVWDFLPRPEGRGKSLEGCGKSPKDMATA
jgi:hypothetical protein